MKWIFFRTKNLLLRKLGLQVAVVDILLLLGLLLLFFFYIRKNLLLLFLLFRSCHNHIGFCRSRDPFCNGFNGTETLKLHLRSRSHKAAGEILTHRVFAVLQETDKGGNLFIRFWLFFAFQYCLSNEGITFIVGRDELASAKRTLLGFLTDSTEVARLLKLFIQKNQLITETDLATAQIVIGSVLIRAVLEDGKTVLRIDLLGNLLLFGKLIRTLHNKDHLGWIALQISFVHLAHAFKLRFIKDGRLACHIRRALTCLVLVATAFEFVLKERFV